MIDLPGRGLMPRASTTMKLSQLLSENMVLHPLVATDKWGLIETMARAAAQAPRSMRVIRAGRRSASEVSA